MRRMLETAMKAHPESFANFDATKNIQDQLQAMVESISPRNLAVEFGLWVDSLHNNWYPYFSVESIHFPHWSMEQLWLAFVMEVKYSKQWLTDSQEWESVKVGVS